MVAYASGSIIFELESDPFYAQYIFPRGLGYAAATTFVLPTGERVCISLERERARGPVGVEAIDQLDGMRRHIARAALVAARLELRYMCMINGLARGAAGYRSGRG